MIASSDKPCCSMVHKTFGLGLVIFLSIAVAGCQSETPHSTAQEQSPAQPMTPQVEAIQSQDQPPQQTETDEQVYSECNCLARQRAVFQEFFDILLA